MEEQGSGKDGGIGNDGSLKVKRTAKELTGRRARRRDFEF